MVDEARKERWRLAWQKPDRDPDRMFEWAREHGDMEACLAGMLASRSFNEPLTKEQQAEVERIGDEVFKRA